MLRRNISAGRRVCVMVASLGAILSSDLSAAVVGLYWDLNGTLSGAGTTPTGTWDTTLTNWNILADGTGTVAAWSSGSVARFSAGTDAINLFTVTLTGTHTAAGLFVEEGAVSFTGAGAISLGANSITVNSGTTLASDSSSRISTTAGSKLFLNAGTLTSTNIGASGTFFDTDTEIVLTGNTTFSYTTANTLNIVQSATKISGTGSVTKSGAGVLAFANTVGNATYSGATTVLDGELRIRTAANPLPTATALTVTSPGIFNLNSVSQQVGSLSGNGKVGTGSGTLTVGDSTSTVFSGTIDNINNAGASGVTTGAGKLTKVGSGTLELTGVNTYTGTFTNLEGTTLVSGGGKLAGPTVDAVVNGGMLVFNIPAQTVLSLSSTGSMGTVSLGTGHTLTVNNGTAKTYSGAITGPGALTKTGAGNWTLSGASDYTGVTTISGGIITAASATALGSVTGNTQVASGAELRVDGAANTFTIAEPIQIAGIGAGGGGAITIQNSSTPTFSGPITLGADSTITVSSTATGTFTNSITSLANQNLTLQGGSGAGGGGTATGVSLGSGGLTKLQGGTWTLKGTNSIGATLVSAGRLTIANAATLNSITVTVQTGATLRDDGIVAGAVQVDSGGLLQGVGSAGSVNVSGTLSPGNSAGKLTVTNALTLADSATTNMEIFNPGTAGTDYDSVAAASVSYEGQLNISFDAGGTFGAGNSFNLFDGTAGLTDFNGVALTGAFSGSLLSAGGGVWSSNAILNGAGLTFLFDGSTGILQLSVQAIPEPLTAAGVLVLTSRLLGRRSRLSM